jgi:hypothetical protein
MSNGSNGSTDVSPYSSTLKNALGQKGYGFSDAQIQQLQDAGVSEGQLLSLGLGSQPQVTASPYVSGGGQGR